MQTTLPPLIEGIHDLDGAILQSYLDYEMTRAQPLLQEGFDACTSVLDVINEIDTDAMARRPNLVSCTQGLVELKQAMLRTEDFHERAKLSMSQVVDWRDRLHAGLRLLGVVRYLWIADSLGFDKCRDL